MNIELMIESVPALVGGVWLTLLLVVISLVLGFIAATGVALARLSHNLVLAGVAYGYVFVFRGTPLLVQFFLIYYGVAPELLQGTVLWPIFREPFWCAILALTLNTAAYGSEIIRGGLLSVPHGQIEAARAAGMSSGQMFRRIAFPVAIRQALPGYGNEIILMVKASSLASVITLMEITGVANRLISRTFAPVEIFIVAGAIYLGINYVATELVRYAEWRLTPYRRPAGERDADPPAVALVLRHPTPLIVGVLFGTAVGIAVGNPV